jgi:hypothetical protein
LLFVAFAGAYANHMAAFVFHKMRREAADCSATGNAEGKGLEAQWKGKKKLQCSISKMIEH